MGSKKVNSLNSCVTVSKYGAEQRRASGQAGELWKSELRSFPPGLPEGRGMGAAAQMIQIK